MLNFIYKIFITPGPIKVFCYINFCIADTNFDITGGDFPSIIGLDFSNSGTKVNINYTKVDIVDELW